MAFRLSLFLKIHFFAIVVSWFTNSESPRVRDSQCGIWDLALTQFKWWDLARSWCNVLILIELQWWDCPVPPKGKKGARSLGGEGGTKLNSNSTWFFSRNSYSSDAAFRRLLGEKNWHIVGLLRPRFKSVWIWCERMIEGEKEGDGAREAEHESATRKPKPAWQGQTPKPFN